MTPTTHRHSWGVACDLAARQHGVVARWQLLGMGLTSDAVRHLLRTERAHPLSRGVYAVGWRQHSDHERWMAAVLACGPGAILSHGSAARLWRIGDERALGIEVSTASGRAHRRDGIVAHRRSRIHEHERVVHEGIPVMAVAATIVDLASYSSRAALERAIREADKRDLADPDRLRAEVGRMPPRPGLPVVRTTLDRLTFVLTDSELERRFVPLARQAGLPSPLTRQWVNGYRVDFFWPELGLVVETDGLRYHRTPSQQARDRRRDNVHLAAGLTPLRFTHGQVRFVPGYVRSTLAVTARRLSQKGR